MKIVLFTIAALSAALTQAVSIDAESEAERGLRRMFESLDTYCNRKLVTEIEELVEDTDAYLNKSLKRYEYV